MASCGVAQKTVVKVQKRARELNLSWPLDESMTDTELQRLMFSKESSVSKSKHMPGYDYIRMNINYTSGQKLNKDLINRLATYKYISEHQNLFITGATGCGKTYMACAFGMEACKQYYNTKYVRMPDLLIDPDIARSE